MTPTCQAGKGWLSASGPLALGKHGLGLDAGAGVHQVVAEEDLRRCGAGGTILGHIVGTDVDGSGSGLFDELDGSGLAVSTADAVGLAFGSLDDQVDATVVSGSLVQLEGEGVTLAHDGGRAGSLHGVNLRRSHQNLAAEGDDLVVQAGEQVGAIEPLVMLDPIEIQPTLLIIML